jgi:beta-glucanase (GH16 family)
MNAALWRHRLLTAIAGGLSLVGCGQSPSTFSSTDASLAGSGGRATPGTGGRPAGSGGEIAGSGGAISGRGGTPSTGGVSVGTGGRARGTGGTTPGTGGRSSATGGSAGTGRDGNGGAASDGGPTRTDGATDPPAGRDLADVGTAPGRDAPGDVAPPADGGIPVPSGYTLVWSDEFDVDGPPNAKNWNYEKGFVRNEELQWYQPGNATVKQGLLVIEGRKERVANPNYQAGSSDWKTNRQYAEYTSTSMTTSGLQSWQYGRFEMRGRIPTSAGMWPAWWTLGVKGEWPSNGEIDIMEYYKGNVLANVACGTATRWQAKWDSSTKSLSSLGGAAWSASFHVWRMDWDDQTIDLYLDDVLLNSVPLSSMLNADGTSPFKQKHYMLVNLAIGGQNGGDPSGTTFPATYEVDYVRVYQKL